MRQGLSRWRIYRYNFDDCLLFLSIYYRCGFDDINFLIIIALHIGFAARVDLHVHLGLLRRQIDGILELLEVYVLQ